MKTRYYGMIMSVFSQNPELLPFKRAVVSCCRSTSDARLHQKIANLLEVHPEFQGLLGPLLSEGVPRG